LIDDCHTSLAVLPNGQLNYKENLNTLVMTVTITIKLFATPSISHQDETKGFMKEVIHRNTIA
jgi:hypothetical protein